MPSLIKNSNSFLAAVNFSGVNRRGLANVGGPRVSMQCVTSAVVGFGADSLN